MAKSKGLTPQEIYKQRKEREERERTAYLPPGLINHGNTCFMNSVLQGLIATRLLFDLVHFDPIPAEIQRTAATPIVSRRSPQLTNGHNLAGPHEHAWVNTMPIGDMFLKLVYKAWESQMSRRRDTLSPKSILGALGQKYDQYLDFAQQDAHEFLRILLDAMRMEEQDIIKKRQPPPVKPPKKRRRTTITSGKSPSIPILESASQSTRQEPNREGEDVQSTSATNSPGQNAGQTKDSDNELPLLSFADMLFSGQLTSILVCQKCKHVSQTYEEFNDISLSIKAEDYFPHNRKRDRFKKIVGRLTAFPGSSSQGQSKDSRKPSMRLPVEPSHLIEMQRSSSVPPSPRIDRDSKQLGEDEDQPVSEPPRRRSLDVSVGVTVPNSDIPEISMQAPTPVVEVADTRPPTGSTTPELDRHDDGGMESEHSHILVNVTGPDDKHVEFVEPKRDGKEKSSVGQSDSTDTEDSKQKGLGSSKDKEKEKSKQDDSWAKIGRRISMSVGLGRPKGGDKEKEKKDKDRKSRSMDRGGGLSSHIKELKEVAIEVADLGIQKSLSAIVPPSRSAKEATPDKRRISSDGRPGASSSTLASSSDAHNSKPSKPLPNPPTSSPSHSSLTAGSNALPINPTTAIPSMFHHVQRSKSPKPPKPTNAEAEYLRKILADVTTSSSSNSPFSIFKPPLLHSHSGHHHSTRPLSTQISAFPGGVNHNVSDKSAGATWLGMGMRNFSGLEECLRMFTAVEVLDGENMVGCRRCWKIQNGVYHGSKERQEDSDQEDQDQDEDRLAFEGGSAAKYPVTLNGITTSSAKKVPHPLQVVSSSLSGSTAVHIPTSISTPTVSMYSQADMSSDTRSISSLPAAATSESDLSLGKVKESDESGHSRLSLSAISEGSSMASIDTNFERPGPGGMPIPVISTTSPQDTPQSWPSESHDLPSHNPDDNRAASYARLVGAANGPVNPSSSTSTPSPNPKLTQALYGYNASSESKDSLLIPRNGRPKYQKRRSYAESTFTDNDSSGDESDTSIGTSISADSVRSSASQGTNTAGSLNGTKPVQPPLPSSSNPQTQTLPAAKVIPPKKAPKPPKPVIMRPAYKRYLIAVPPPVLVIHLKRFQQTSKTPLMSFSHGFKKLEDYISFPEHLDLLPFLAPKKEDYGLGKKNKKTDHKSKEEARCMYRLYAVVVHIGNMLGGHYIAYTALPENPPQSAPPTVANGDGNGAASTSETTGDRKETSADLSSQPAKPIERQWAYISDTTVRLTTLEEVLHAKAYICMYERC